jgi:hypothetical protein
VEVKVVKKQIIIIGIVVLFISTGSSGCELFDDSGVQSCDETKVPEVIIWVRPGIHYIHAEKMNRSYSITCTVYKVPCGTTASSSDVFHYTVVNGSNDWYPSDIGLLYAVRNSQDYIIIQTELDYMDLNYPELGTYYADKDYYRLSYAELSDDADGIINVPIFLEDNS